MSAEKESAQSGASTSTPAPPRPCSGQSQDLILINFVVQEGHKFALEPLGAGSRAVEAVRERYPGLLFSPKGFQNRLLHIQNHIADYSLPPDKRQILATNLGYPDGSNDAEPGTRTYDTPHETVPPKTKKPATSKKTTNTQTAGKDIQLAAPVALGSAAQGSTDDVQSSTTGKRNITEISETRKKARTSSSPAQAAAGRLGDNDDPVPSTSAPSRLDATTESRPAGRRLERKSAEHEEHVKLLTDRAYNARILVIQQFAANHEAVLVMLGDFIEALKYSSVSEDKRIQDCIGSLEALHKLFSCGRF